VEREPDGFGPYAPPSREGSAGRRPDETRRRDDDERGVRSAAEEAVQRATQGEERPALRLVCRPPGMAGEGIGKPGRKPKKAAKAQPDRRGAAPRVVANPAKLGETLVRAGQALERGYENQTLRLLRPYREAMPEDTTVRELMGLAYYRQGKWAAAIKELEAYYKLTALTTHHPILMDSFRALGRHKRTDELWEELRAVSPAADIVAEGRIVAAGSLADRGKLPEAIALLERAAKQPRHVADHHLRLWYALADLQERAGEYAAARTLFRRVSSHDPTFVDVAERLASLT
jgi:tetratricopeptide (TPR) repeat protein